VLGGTGAAGCHNGARKRTNDGEVGTSGQGRNET
jgi:hypothetical protein